MLLTFAVMLGLAVGSFLNVLVLRLQASQTLAGRSHCPRCQHQLPWYHNIPVLSFIWLHGRCGFCQLSISWQYPLVELSTGLLFGLGAAKFGDWGVPTFLTYLVVVSFAVTLFVYDFKYQLLPDSLTLPGVVIIAALNLWRGLSWFSLLWGAGLAASFFALQFWLSRGRWIGAGDIRLGLWLGVALAWPQTVVALVLAYWVGAVVGLSLVLVGRRHFQSELPFGTFLTAATVVTFLWGQVIWDWYMGVLGF
ncbi:MAG: prepilin peptidase [Candidatus Kerfeldbacteria bacterium]|nr:prepilin peptidase [Candidatus Kerfeldbacteria bacterium]